jgi:hypothetical protein
MDQSYNINDQLKKLILKLPNMFEKQNDKKYDKQETTPMITTFPETIMTNSNDEEKMTPWGTPRSKMGSNDWNRVQ